MRFLHGNKLYKLKFAFKESKFDKLSKNSGKNRSVQKKGAIFNHQFLVLSRKYKKWCK
jgi:hypothetical protein